jgi:5-methylcytosine-specific restriction endonuclease McrA
MASKAKIPKALREQVWLKQLGPIYSKKCTVSWCKNIITAFNFDCGHDIPESKGGETILENLYPICRNCNLSMGSSYTLKEWNALSKPATCVDLWRFAFKGSGTASDPRTTNQNGRHTK